MLTEIKHQGQAYYDEAVRLHPRRSTIIEESVAFAFGRSPPKVIEAGYERVRLKWVKPDALRSPTAITDTQK